MDRRLIEIASQLSKLSDKFNLIIAELDLSSSFNRVLVHLTEREGFRLKVYRDTLGIPTVGVGHVVRPEDNLKVGDIITEERVRALLEKDARAAFEAANDQMDELGINSSDFLVALTSVNFQLGIMWMKKFPKTWALMKEGRYNEAAVEAADSLWATQTPQRVRDFQKALRDLEM